jgi:hypothetical protein
MVLLSTPVVAVSRTSRCPGVLYNGSARHCGALAGTSAGCSRAEGAPAALAGGRQLRSTGWILPRYSRGTGAHGCCSGTPRAARAVPSCAGAYVLGRILSNECPAGSVRIETEAACRTAAAASGKTVGSPFVVTDSSDPRGCYSYLSNIAYFNTHAVGAAFVYAQLLCADVSTGASRSGARGCAWECTPASAAAPGVWDVT